VTDLVIDASVAVKWVVPEPDTPAALALRRRYRLVAPNLLVLECANVFWKKVRRHELTVEEALISAEAIAQAGIELSALPKAEAVTRLSLELDHPAYDCAYIALALERQCQFATADRRLIEAIRRSVRRDLDQTVVLFTELVQQGD